MLISQMTQSIGFKSLITFNLARRHCRFPVCNLSKTFPFRPVFRLKVPFLKCFHPVSRQFKIWTMYMHSWKMTKTARTKNLSRASDRECYRLIRWRKIERRIKWRFQG